MAKPSAEFVVGMLGTWLSRGVAAPLAINYLEVELFNVTKHSVCHAIVSLFYSNLFYIGRLGKRSDICGDRYLLALFFHHIIFGFLLFSFILLVVSEFFRRISMSGLKRYSYVSFLPEIGALIPKWP